MTYVEELFNQAYLADVPKNQQDVLLLPKGISEGCSISLYVDRDFFVEMLRKQRGKDGMNEAILSTILSAPEKNNFLVFTILAKNVNLMRIYMEKLEGYTENISTKEEDSKFNRELFRAMTEMESENVESNNPTEDTASVEPDVSAFEATPQELANTEAEHYVDQTYSLEALEKEKNAFLAEMEKGLEKFCKLLSISPIHFDSTEQDNKDYEPTEEDLLNKDKYTKEAEKVNRDMERLVCKDALHLLFSLEDMPHNLKDEFMHGVVELMPLLDEESQLNVMNTLTATFMGKSTNNADLKDAISILSEAGIKNYKFDSVDKLHAIMIAFFYSDEEDVK